jgi:Flp pilus assembly protein TadD
MAGADEPTSREQARIAEIVRATLSAIQVELRSKGSPLGRVFAGIRFIATNWLFFLFVSSIIGAFIGWGVFGISLLQPLEKIAFEQKKYQQEESALLLKERMAGRHIALANDLLNVGQADGARVEFEQALALDPTNADAHYGLMKTRIFIPIDAKEFDLEVSEKRLRLLLEERPDDPHVLTFLGMVYFYADPAEAEKYLNRSMQIDPDQAATHQALGVLHDLRGEGDKALAEYERAVQLSEWNVTYRNNVGYQYLLRGDLEKARQSYELLVNLDGSFLLPYLTLGMVYRQDGNAELAYNLHTTMLELLRDPKYNQMTKNSGEWFFHAGERTEHLFSVEEKENYALLNAALSAFVTGRTAEARQYLAEAKGMVLQSSLRLQDLIISDCRLLEERNPRFAGTTAQFLALFAP